MAEQDHSEPVKPKRMPPSRKGKGPTPSSWKPGCPSPNPRGRPRAGLAFAERVRERVDPDKVIDLAIRVLEDEKLTPQERLREVWPLIDRGFVKPPTHLDTTVRDGGVDEFDVSKLSDERLCEILRDLEACRVSAPSQQATAGEVSLTDGAASERGDG